ncbi:hypothetical protein [Nannocystis pusilla]|uniref:hypothetical protein n=1 Tax=Nannocystis pusilla TaxID=889268 RepID=UPI003B7DC049
MCIPARVSATIARQPCTGTRSTCDTLPPRSSLTNVTATQLATSLSTCAATRMLSGPCTGSDSDTSTARRSSARSGGGRTSERTYRRIPSGVGRRPADWCGCAT